MDVLNVCNGYYVFYRSNTLKDLFRLMEEKVEMLVQARSDSPICFVMDSLSVLLSFGIEVQEILLFVRHCFRILSSKQVCCLHFYY